MYFSDWSRGIPFAKDPAVVTFKNQYFMYYSVPPIYPSSGWSIGIAISRDLDNWENIAYMYATMECEKKGFTAPGAIVIDNKIHIFYQTYGNHEKDAICHAVSSDGVNFQRNPDNPVWHPQGNWTCGRAIDADVIIHGKQLYLYAATRDPSMKVQMITLAVAPLDSGFGKNTWVQLIDGPILKPELPWEHDCIEAPAVCKYNGRFFMFYGGAYNNTPQQIGCAVSDDGIRWTRLGNQPFLKNGKPGQWNASESGHPYIFIDDKGQYHLFYQGNNDMGKSWYLSRLELGWRNEQPYIAVDTEF